MNGFTDMGQDPQTELVKLNDKPFLNGRVAERAKSTHLADDHILSKLNCLNAILGCSPIYIIIPFITSVLIFLMIEHMSSVLIPANQESVIVHYINRMDFVLWGRKCEISQA